MSNENKKPDSNELALFSSLRYEEATLRYIDDYQKRWDITDKERQIVLKWMSSRMEDIKGRL